MLLLMFSEENQTAHAAAFRHARKLGYLLFAPCLVLPGMALGVGYLSDALGWKVPEELIRIGEVACILAGTVWIAAVMRRIAVLAGIRSGFLRTAAVFLAYAVANLVIGSFIILLATLPFGPH